MSSSDAAIKKVMTTLDRVHPLTWSMHSEVNDMEESEGLMGSCVTNELKQLSQYRNQWFQCWNCEP